MSNGFKVGGKDIEIPEIGGEKVIRLMDLSARIGTQYPLIRGKHDAFVSAYREASLDRGEEPENPSGQEIMAVLVGDIWRVAKPELLELIGLLPLKDSELEEADDQGGEAAVNSLIKNKSKELIRQANNATEILGMAAVCLRVVVEEVQGSVEGVGKVLEGLGLSQVQNGNKKSPSTRNAPK